MIEILTDILNKMKAWQHSITRTCHGKIIYGFCMHCREHYLDYQLNKARRKFGDEVFDL